MGLLTFALNVTLDGCCDHREGIADDALLRYYTRLMDGAGGMLFGRVTYEMMESAWPAVARDPKARPAFRAWARKLEAKPKHVVSTTRRDFPWSNTFRVDGNLREAMAWGTAAGAANASVYGAGFIDKTEVERLVGLTRVRRIEG